MLVKLLRALFLNVRLLVIKTCNKKAKFGRGFRFDLKTQLDIRNNKFLVGENVYLRSNPNGYHAGMPFPTTVLIDKPGAQCIIGSNSRINGAYIHAQKSIYIGENCVIAAGVNIIDSNGHEVYSINRTQGRDTPEEIIIDDNVWVGLNAVILKGSIIGKNSVIAAGSVVKGEFPSNVLIQGSPAKVIKELDIINEASNTP